MGIWEEEILCGKFQSYSISFMQTNDFSIKLVLGQCLDLLESKPEVRLAAVPEPPTAAPRS
jgi:hypothetical protein